MKFLIAIIFATITWYPIGWVIYEITRNEMLSIIVTSIISLIIFFISITKLSYKIITSMSSRAIGAVKDIKDEIMFNIEQKSAELYAQAEEEYNNGEIDKRLWAKALINAKGDEKLRKVEYMKLRVKQLKKKV